MRKCVCGHKRGDHAKRYSKECDICNCTGYVPRPKMVGKPNSVGVDDFLKHLKLQERMREAAQKR